ncbi:MAG: hypothetical protein AAB497_00885 [Patescibacteria group bacterium]
MKKSKNTRVSKNERGDKVITLCGVSNCCPTVTIDRGGNHVIKDDFGGSVVLSKEQFGMLKEV